MKKTNVKAMAIAMASILSVSMVGAMSSSAVDATVTGKITNNQAEGTDNITYSDTVDSVNPTKANTQVRYYALDDDYNPDEPGEDIPNWEKSSDFTVTVPAAVWFGDEKGYNKDTDTTFKDLVDANKKIEISGLFSNKDEISVKPCATFEMTGVKTGATATATAGLKNSGNTAIEKLSLVGDLTNKDNKATATLVLGWVNDKAPEIDTWKGIITYTVTRAAATPTGGTE